MQWASVRTALIITMLQGWALRQIDFVLLFPQVDIIHDNYIHLPKGVKTIHRGGKLYVLEMKKKPLQSKECWKKYVMIIYWKHL